MIFLYVEVRLIRVESGYNHNFPATIPHSPHVGECVSAALVGFVGSAVDVFDRYDALTFNDTYSPNLAMMTTDQYALGRGPLSKLCCIAAASVYGRPTDPATLFATPYPVLFPTPRVS